MAEVLEATGGDGGDGGGSSVTAYGGAEASGGGWTWRAEFPGGVGRARKRGG